MSARDVEAVAREVLGKHLPRRVTCGDEWLWECVDSECPWVDSRIAEGLEAHRAHVAAELAAALGGDA